MTPSIDLSAVDPHTVAALRDVDTSPGRLSTYRLLAVQERREILLALYLRDGRTPKDIARAVGVHASNIGRQLNRAGVPIVRAGKTPGDASTRTVPVELVRAAKQRVHDALLPLSRDARAEVLAWASSTLAAR